MSFFSYLCKGRKYAERCLGIILSVILIVTMMPTNAIGRVHAESVTDADAEEFPAFSGQAKADGVLITVKTPEGVFPADAKLSVGKMPEEIRENAGKAVDAARREGAVPVRSCALDVRVLDAEGNELKLAKGQTANITFAFSGEANKNLEATVYKIKEIPADGEAASRVAPRILRDAVWDAKTNTVDVPADSFSSFVVEFTRKVQQDTEKEEETATPEKNEKSSSDTEDGESASVKDESSATDDGDADSAPAANPGEEESTAMFPEFSQQSDVDGVIITVSAPEGTFPEKATLSIEKMTKEEQEKAEEAVGAVRPDGVNPALSYTYDIKVLDAEGNELQPADGKKVEITFAMAPAADTNLEPAVYHITEATEGEGAGGLAAEALKTDVNENDQTVAVETDGFSLYTVEFTYEDKQYVLKGGESIALDEILKEVRLTGQVEKAEVSKEELFSVSEKDGVWTLTSHQAFDTTEWLKVTIGGADYVITVTDEEASGTKEVSGPEKKGTATEEATDSEKKEAATEEATDSEKKEAATSSPKSENQKRALKASRSLSEGITTVVTFSSGGNSFVYYFDGEGDTLLLSDIFSELGLGYGWDHASYVAVINKEFEGEEGEDFDPLIFDASHADYGDWKITLRRDIFTEEATLKVGTSKGETIYITATNNEVLGVSTWDGLQNAINMAPAGTPRTIIMTEDIENDDDDVPNKNRIMVNGSRQVTLDLNGKVLNGQWRFYSPAGSGRNPYAGRDRHVLEVNGNAELTIRDSSGEKTYYEPYDCEYDAGTITGGCAYHGGGIYIAKGAKCTIESGTIKDNGANNTGAGIYTEGTFVMTGGAIVGNTAFDDDEDNTTKGGGIYCNKTGTVSLENAVISDNSAFDGAGLAIYQNSGEALIRSCTITGNDGMEGSIYSLKPKSVTGGGGLYFEGSSIRLEDTDVTGNITYGDGGGIYVKSGTVTASGCKLENNTADEEDSLGGGIYSNGDTTLDSCSVRENKAGDKGGGVFKYPSKPLRICGDTVITGNEAAYGGGVHAITGNGRLYLGYDSPTAGESSIRVEENTGGGDMYLGDGAKLMIASGKLANSSSIGISMTEIGVFTTGFTAMMGENVTPDTYFYGDDSSYIVYLKDDEAALMLDLNEGQKFLKRSERVEANVGRLGSASWMAGVSGERYLNEINIPGTHDTSMNNVSRKGCLSGAFGQVQAKTQREYLDEQLEHGARFFDIRMKTQYCAREVNIGGLGLGLAGASVFIPVVGVPIAVVVGVASSVTLFNGSSLPVYKDDGVNLWTCHGRSAAGTFYALDHDNDNLSVAEELEWMKEFLREHPTETIIIDARAETDAKEGEDFYGPLRRFSGIMEELTKEINPSTGESYVYWEDGKVGERFTRWPKLKECRGKIVIFPSKGDNAANTIGGLCKDTDGITVETGPGNYKDGTARAENLKQFIQTMETPIPLNAMGGQMKEFNWIQTNTTDTTFMKTPVGLAENYVLPVVFGSDGLVNESKKGTYFGWFSIDAAKVNHLRDVWITNFPDDLEYCTIKVKCGYSGEDVPEDQTYKVLKGSEITIPGCIYDGAQADKFLGWKSSADGETYIVNNTYNVGDKNLVTFTAQWSDQVQTPVTVVWKDADDVDGLRPDTLNIKYNEDYTKTAKADEGWSAMLSGQLTDDPAVEDVPGYKAVMDGNEGQEGYTITMTHTPDVSVAAKGTVTWNDKYDKDKIRPETVTLHLYRNGHEIKSVTTSEAEGWAFDFGTYERYENGELVAYKLVEDDFEFDTNKALTGYTYGIEAVEGEKKEITGFEVTNTHEVTTSVMYARVEWDDNDNAARERPDSVKLQWKKDGKPYGDPIVLEPTDEGEWVAGLELTYAEITKLRAEQEALAEQYDVGELSDEEFVNALEETISFTIKQNSIRHYTTTITLEEGEEAADGTSTDAYFRILNTYDPEAVKHELTFYEDTEGKRVWKEITLNEGTSLERYADYGTEEPNVLEKEGYTFAGWATDKNINVDSYRDKNGNLNPGFGENGEKLVDWNTTISADMNVYPIWIPDRFKVAIEPGSDDVIIADEQEFRFTVNKDEKIAMRNLVNAAREGYELDGWYTKDGELWNGDNWRTLEYVTEGWNETAGWGVEPKYCDKDEDGETIIRVNDERKYNYYTLTLTARWTAKPVTIKYDLGDHAASGAAVPENGEVTLGNTVTLAEAPKAASEYLFNGWKAPDGTVYSGRGTFFFDDWAAQDDPEAESHSITMTAQYVEKAKVRLIFDADGGTAVDPVTDYEGNSVDLSESRFSTTRAGYDFDGWYNSAGTKCEGKYTFKEDETLTAHWKAKNYTVTFDSTGGSKVSPQTIQWGKTAKKPADPKRSGYEFKGWYADKNLKNAFDFSQKITADTTVYAKWKKTTASGTSGVLFAKMTTKGKKGLKVTWSKVKGAEGYDVFFARCNTAKKVYKYKKVKTLKGNAKLSWTKTGLKKGVAYKAYVKAWTKKSGKKVYLKKSPTMHGYTGGYSKKCTNAKKVILKSKKSVTLKVSKTSRIKATVKKLKKNRLLIPKGHAARLRYLSTNKKVAVVSKTGKITAKGKGTCRIYVYAANGVYKLVSVTVK